MLLTSCDKTELVDSNEDGLENVEEAEVFAKIKDMQTFENILKGENSYVAEEEFVSMLDILTLIDTTDDEAEYLRLIEEHKNILTFDKDGTPDLIVESPELASMLSPKGYLQIGNSILKIEQEDVKIIEDGDISKINLLENTFVTDETNNITVHKITRQATLKYSSSDNKYSPDYKYKLKVKKYAINYGVFFSVGGKLTHYKKTTKWGVTKYRQYATQMHINVVWSGLTFDVGGPTITYPAGDIEKDKNTEIISRFVNPYGGSQLVHNLEVSDLEVSYETNSGINGTY